MNIRSKFSYVVAGFVGGMAFLISCGGGSSGSSLSEAVAEVPVNQMICYQTSGFLVDWDPSPLAIKPVPQDSLACYGTDGTNRITSLDTVYSEGWRNQAITLTGGIVWIFVR